MKEILTLETGLYVDKNTSRKPIYTTEIGDNRQHLTLEKVLKNTLDSLPIYLRFDYLKGSVEDRNKYSKKYKIIIEEV